MPRNEERRQLRLATLDTLSSRIELATQAAKDLHVRSRAQPRQVRVRAPLFANGTFSDGAFDEAEADQAEDDVAQEGEALLLGAQNRGSRMAELRTPPPIARISAPRGVNLQLYLLTLFEAQCRKRNGFAESCQIPVSGPGLSWIDLVVSQATQNLTAQVRVTEKQNRARQIRSAIKRLADEGLVVRENDPAKLSPLTLLHESGQSQLDPRPYVIPQDYEGKRTLVGLPSQFFTRGWIYVLSDSEIRMYLVLKHLASRFPESHIRQGVYLTNFDRSRRYFVSRDVYEAHIMLTRFGLIERIPDHWRHRDGKLAGYEEISARGLLLPAHRFRIIEENPFFVSPIGRVRRALLNYPPTITRPTSTG